MMLMAVAVMLTLDAKRRGGGVEILLVVDKGNVEAIAGAALVNVDGVAREHSTFAHRRNHHSLARPSPSLDDLNIRNLSSP
ncbi:hypothetical protein E2C01_033373 [Portunus trituberculatus]|uniref:Uncharacterized protein n=1 Tax=Portunus trituberculatus TaxID=210409 RepID=A0A5B7F5C7_PORTR|nr:hypothetical protein [Portunus trituberculatus]